MDLNHKNNIYGTQTNWNHTPHRKTVQVTEALEKREFAIKTEEQYPQLVKFELFNERCSWLDKYQKEEQVKVFFIQLVAFRLETLEKAEPYSKQQKKKEEPIPQAEDDDLPF